MIQIKGILQRLLAANNVELNTFKCQLRHSLSRTTLTPRAITEVLSRHQINLTRAQLPSYVKSIECNQLASNNPIEDRLRVSSVQIPGVDEPTLILGVFDGHGGGTTADLISRRLFNYIAVSLYPEPRKLKISNHGQLQNIIVDLHSSPKQEEFSRIRDTELNSLSTYKNELPTNYERDIIASIKSSFKRCDDDLAREIQNNLMGPRLGNDLLHYYLRAAVSGCCAVVLVIHQGVGYLASAGDCRAVLGIINKSFDKSLGFKACELNEEHNCDSVNEVRRLTNTHPKSEQNTMIKHNRLLGHLMPFRAFGDFNYKWSADLIKACGITRAFGSHIIPSNYETPPYLIVEPDVNPVQIIDNGENDVKDDSGGQSERYLVIASDGLWELFESSREVIETIVDHSRNAKSNSTDEDYDYEDEEEYDKNCATHILRSALQAGTPQDVGLNPTELKRLYHIRLESTLTLPQSVVRNFRDDISIIVLKL